LSYTLDIFKFQLYCEKLNFDTDSLSNLCFELQNKNKDYGRISSNLGGWQSDDLFDAYTIISNLRKLIYNHIDIYSKNFKLNKKLKLDNLWININGYKDLNLPHIHPNNILSGVFYVKVPKNSGKIRFENPCLDLMEGVYQNSILEYNSINSATWSLEPDENLLILFPSFLKHSVLPNMNKKEKRISISFNAGII
jgi:uncharacterized protein (TIGR02466 family)